MGLIPVRILRSGKKESRQLDFPFKCIMINSSIFIEGTNRENQ